MRHFLATLAVAPLPLGMRVATTKALLVTLARGTQRLGSGSSSAAVGAIALTTVAMAADEHRAAAAGTEITSSWSLHRQEKPMGIRQNRSKSEILSTQRRPPGHGARHRLKLPRLGPVSRLLPKAAAFLAHSPLPRHHPGSTTTGHQPESPRIDSPPCERGGLQSPSGLLPTPPARTSNPSPVQQQQLKPKPTPTNLLQPDSSGFQ